MKHVFVWTLSEVIGLTCLCLFVVGFPLALAWEKWGIPMQNRYLLWRAQRLGLCESCYGRGWWMLGTRREKCSKCNGKGKVTP